MNKCQRCRSELIRVMAKCDDRCCIQYEDLNYNDYVPEPLGIGSGDYVKFAFCPHCGQMDGEFPRDVIIWKE